MAIFKRARCGACGFNRREPKQGRTIAPCPKCSGSMLLMENWYIDYRLHGKQCTEAVGPSKKEAEDALSKIKTSIREGRFFDKASSTPWEEAVEQFIAWGKANVKATTVRMYRNSLKNMEPHFERYTLDKITPHMVEQFKAMRLAKGVKPATVNRDLATIKRLFSLSEHWGLVEMDRVRKVKLLKENNERLRYLTANEEANLINACQTPHLRLAVLIALNTGLRKDGVFTLKWSEVDFELNRISKLVKGDKRVYIPLTPALRDALLDAKKGKVLSQYALPSPKCAGEPCTDLKRGFSMALRAARIKDFRFHDLRHTFATNFLRRTKDINALREILGHGDLKMTMRYAHILDEHLREAMDVFGRNGGKDKMAVVHISNM